MKANFFAVALSLFVLSIPIHAATSPLSQQPVKSNLVKIDLNKADVKVLSKSFKGIGKKRAEAIVKYRGEQGKFNSIEDLAKVRGFGKQFVKNHLSQLQEVFTTN
jgi:competence protein ComEA